MSPGTYAELTAVRPADPSQVRVDTGEKVPNTRESHRFRVYDGDGQYLGAFATWKEAHSWAHARVADGALATVEIEQRQGRLSWFVRGGGCELVAWVSGPRTPGCAAAARAERVPLR